MNNSVTVLLKIISCSHFSLEKRQIPSESNIEVFRGHSFFFFFFFCLLSFAAVVVAISWAAPSAYGGSQARG